MLLEGSAIVLAGGTGRVGGATLRTAVAEGARVLVLSRSRESAERTIERCVEEGQRARALAFQADLLHEEDGEAAIREAQRRFGRVDAVVSLAGGGSRFVAIADSTIDDLRQSLANNAVAAYNLMIPALRAMLAQEPLPGARSRGRLVAVTAGSSLDPQPRFGLMGAGKSAVNILMKAIAREHKADGIVANAVVLGGVATEAAREYLDATEFAAATTPEEVADVLTFLAGDRSSGINGALVEVNAREVD
jgi:NAD(P)-dependent dehydrogenase (short-subunit alcohol dehydrogenase family)